MKIIIEFTSFIGVITLFAFCFVALFAGNTTLLWIGALGLGMLLMLAYAGDRCSARRRREYWTSDRP